MSNQQSLPLESPTLSLRHSPSNHDPNLQLSSREMGKTHAPLTGVGSEAVNFSPAALIDVPLAPEPSSTTSSTLSAPHSEDEILSNSSLPSSTPTTPPNNPVTFHPSSLQPSLLNLKRDQINQSVPAPTGNSTPNSTLNVIGTPDLEMASRLTDASGASTPPKDLGDQGADEDEPTNATVGREFGFGIAAPETVKKFLEESKPTPANSNPTSSTSSPALTPANSKEKTELEKLKSTIEKKEEMLEKLNQKMTNDHKPLSGMERLRAVGEAHKSDPPNKARDAPKILEKHEKKLFGKLFGDKGKEKEKEKEKEKDSVSSQKMDKGTNAVVNNGSASKESKDSGGLKLMRRLSGKKEELEAKKTPGSTPQTQAKPLKEEISATNNMGPISKIKETAASALHPSNQTASSSKPSNQPPAPLSASNLAKVPQQQKPAPARKFSITSKKSDDGKSEGGKSHKTDGGKSARSTGTSLHDKYGVCEKTAIGKGATAVVRLAHKWDRNSERLYAVKEFRKRRKGENEKEYVKKLTSEFCISSTLHHAHVVETVDLLQDENKNWCEVMEYCPGGDLYAAIKRGSMSRNAINTYFKQTISGVDYLHSMGVAHRDIKPENLLLDAQGRIKITDFGVSDVFRMVWEKNTHLSKGLCGSEPYIAPEQFEQKEYDARLLDIWAVAIVYYTMELQELPWRVAKIADPTFQGYIMGYPNSPSPTPLNELPRECRHIMKKMLDPNPKTRVLTDVILKDPWVMSISDELSKEDLDTVGLGELAVD